MSFNSVKIYAGSQDASSVFSTRPSCALSNS